MKKLLIIVCIFCAVACFLFPMTYFKSNTDKMEVKVSHILVNSKEDAEKIKQNILDKKISFKEAAEKYSKCFSSENAGSLGYVQKGRLYENIENYIFTTKDYFKISEPIETDDGWHLVVVNGVRYFSDKENFSKRHFMTKDDARYIDMVEN